MAGHISSFYELMRVTQDWTVQNGVQEDTARRFISSFYSSMAAAADSSHHSFAELSEEVRQKKILFILYLPCEMCLSLQ